MRSFLRVVSFCCGTALLLGAAAASAQTSSQTFSDTTDVVVVEVPVQVLKDGEPVRGLTAEDFEVYEGRRKLPVTGFEMLDLNPGTPQESWQAARPVSARRHFLLLFDLAFSTPRALVQGQAAARDMLEELHPSDLVAVASYAPSTGPALLLGFTTDRQQVRTALDNLGNPEMFGLTPDPLRLVLIGDAVMGQAGAGGGDGGGYGGSMGGAGPRADDRKAAIAAAIAGAGGGPGGSVSAAIERADRDTRRRAVTSMARAFEDLAKTVGGLYGRKYVVFFSEGFDSAILGGTTNVDEQNQMAEMATKSAVGAVVGVDSEKRFGSTEAANDLERMLTEFRRADCVIQAVDIGGLRERGGPENQWAGGRDSLFLLADSTGGELYENYNELSAAMAQMLRRTSVTYVLALQPEGLKRDGSYHEIRVALKGTHKGSRVVHRPGYYAPRPFQQQNATERILQTARNVMGQEKGTIGTSVLVAPFHQGGGQAYVPVIVEVDGPSLMSGTEGWALPVEIYAYAFDAQGQARDFFSQTVGLELLKVGSALQKSGLKFFGHLDLPPGDWAVRVLVRNAATGAAGMKSVDVRVPEFGKQAPLLLPAFFPEAPGKWLLVRESRPSAQAAYPFMAGNEPYIPASMPELAPGREATVSLVAYHLPAGEVQAEARVRTADGRDAGTGRLRIVERHGSGEDGAERLTAVFEPPAGLQAGEYLLLVTLTGPAGDAQSSVVSAASFEVPAGGVS